MGRVSDVVYGLAEEVGRQLGLEVVEVTFAKEGRDAVLRITIDKPEGITSDDCERFSKAIDGLLDEADPIAGPYLLEVSSPGLERPLKKAADFMRFAGQKAELRLNAAFKVRKRWQGILRGWDPAGEGGVILEVDGALLTIPWSLVARAKLMPDWS
ncbi:MAG TPA: ribosome maturation factor RimP [Firmicutes bacterium]|jgi:ribosome maturation factor RimP|nr:ribosome maturation factor RimP [Bacillota bacterium]HPT66563.1 ribosome maturation factor RimP [Bacillota bacterium]